jgi:membrane protein DedA with SNARE-associated domain
VKEEEEGRKRRKKVEKSRDLSWFEQFGIVLKILGRFICFLRPK